MLDLKLGLSLAIHVNKSRNFVNTASGRCYQGLRYQGGMVGLIFTLLLNISCPQIQINILFAVLEKCSKAASVL